MRASRRLLPLTVAYAVFTLGTIPISLAYNVGASPEGDASDMPLRGSGFTPPLFLPVLLIAGAAIARRSPRHWAIAGAGLDSLVSLAILAGSTLNVPNDVRAVRAVGGPPWLTYLLAGLSGVLALAILLHAVGALRGLLRRRSEEVN